MAKINSPIYIPNPLSAIAGIATLPFIEHHDVTNPQYSGQAFAPLNPQLTQDLLSQATQQFLLPNAILK